MTRAANLHANGIIVKQKAKQKDEYYLLLRFLIYNHSDYAHTSTLFSVTFGCAQCGSR